MDAFFWTMIIATFTVNIIHSTNPHFPEMMRVNPATVFLLVTIVGVLIAIL